MSRNSNDGAAFTVKSETMRPPKVGVDSSSVLPEAHNSEDMMEKASILAGKLTGSQTVELPPEFQALYELATQQE